MPADYLSFHFIGDTKRSELDDALLSKCLPEIWINRQLIKENNSTSQQINTLGCSLYTAMGTGNTV